MGQGRTARPGVAERLFSCLSEATQAGRLRSIIHRTEVEKTPSRYAILVQHPDEPLRHVLRTLYLGVDLRGTGDWVLLGPDLDLPDMARQVVFQNLARSLNERLRGHARFSVTKFEETAGRKLKVVRFPELPLNRGLDSAGR